MEHANDLRVQRTYKLLTDALMNMLCEQSFDTITVRTLCERAMVRPATFYKHFANKEELFLSIVQHKQQQFRTGNPYRDVPGSSRNYYVSLVDQTLHFLEQNKTMVDSVIRSSAASLLLEPLSEQIATQVCQEFQEDEKRGVSLPGKPGSHGTAVHRRTRSTRKMVGTQQLGNPTRGTRGGMPTHPQYQC